MKDSNASEVIHKDVVIIGNGPSGLALSYMLSGNIPYLISDAHPDELLSARLSTVSRSLIHEDLAYLSEGLEGRSTNPVSLLLDALTNPCADMGFELEPLIEWRKDGVEIDHVVLGKGPPGGSWHKMDPHILTLSLGSWMALPGLPYTTRDGSEKRASASNVAKYYVQYAKEMGLERFFRNGVCVLNIKQQAPENRKWVERLEAYQRAEHCTAPEAKEERRMCPLSSALSFIRLRTRKCKRRRDCLVRNDLSPNRKIREIQKASFDPSVHSNLVDLCRPPPDLCRGKPRSISFSCDYDDFKSSCDSLSKSFSDQGSFMSSLKNSRSLDFNAIAEVPEALHCDSPPRVNDCDQWRIETYDAATGKCVTYVSKYLVLANGASDLPNRLAIPGHEEDPAWLLHDVRSLEMELDLYLSDKPTDPDPVLVIGAGLSAADAIIATRGRNIPVLHVFRNKNSDLGKQLPENMYPEYHKVHQMMQDGGSLYPLYKALPECTPIRFDETERKVTLLTKTGEELKFNVSFAAVLIGSQPDLSFLSNFTSLGVNKKQPVDSKTNNVDIDRLTHSVRGLEGLYALGPLAGDNFVRFIPGGAVAVLSDLYHKHRY